jgi:hypothetical protein
MLRQYKEFPWLNPLHFSLELLHLPFQLISPHVHDCVVTFFDETLEVITKAHFGVHHRRDVQQNREAGDADALVLIPHGTDVCVLMSALYLTYLGIDWDIFSPVGGPLSRHSRPMHGIASRHLGGR